MEAKIDLFSNLQNFLHRIEMSLRGDKFFSPPPHTHVWKMNENMVFLAISKNKKIKTASFRYFPLIV